MAGLITGCGSMGYYRQAISGQYEILHRREPIQSVLGRTNTSPALREKLQLVLGLREFAERELRLKTDGHYAKYADLGRRYVVWNVYAAPEFSLEPKKWWYPVVGKLKYRGFFSEKEARECGARLAKEGYDVYVGGVDAYSTLGYFKDPVLNTFIYNQAPDLAEILFHELAHQRVFAKGDTDFNEAFATAVGEEGVRRWLATKNDPKLRAEYDLELRRKDQFVALVMKARAELKEVYGEEKGNRSRTEPDLPATQRHKNGRQLEMSREAIEAASTNSLVAVKRARKGEVIAKLRTEYAQLKTSWGGYAGYDHWFQRSLNNAQLSTVATYYTLLPAFERLLAQNGGDLQKFYADAKALASLPKEERQQRMAALAKSPRAVVVADHPFVE
ncbi:MAG TPA: aminopeptidase [Verrucomicrobiae bacterium]